MAFFTPPTPFPYTLSQLATIYIYTYCSILTLIATGAGCGGGVTALRFSTEKHHTHIKLTPHTCARSTLPHTVAHTIIRIPKPRTHPPTHTNARDFDRSPGPNSHHLISTFVVCCASDSLHRSLKCLRLRFQGTWNKAKKRNHIFQRNHYPARDDGVRSIRGTRNTFHMQMLFWGYLLFFFFWLSLVQGLFHGT